MVVVRGDYLARRSKSNGDYQSRKHYHYRNWWLVKHNTKSTGGVQLGTITLPEKFVGKRVRFKVEIIGGIENEM